MNPVNRVMLICALVPGLWPMTALASPDRSPLQVADLRSFFHGDPPPLPKAPPPKQLAVVSTSPGVTADMQIESFLRAFADAVKARDGKAMLPRLSEKYAIDDLPGDRKAPELFLQAVEQIAGPVEIVVMSVEIKNSVRTAKVEFRYGADKIKLKTFQFDAAGKLLWSDLFKLQAKRAGA